MTVDESNAESDSDKLTQLLDQNRRLLEAIEDLRARSDELRDIALTGHRLTFEAVRLAEQRAVLVRELDILRFDETMWIRVPDSQALEGPIDWAALEQEELGHAIPDASGAVRDWLTPAELAEVGDLAVRVVQEWIKGTKVRQDESRRPWQAGRAPVDGSTGEKYRRVWVPGVADGFWESDGMRRRRDALLATWPRGRGWRKPDGRPTWRCLHPLQLPVALDRISR
jgi:hypothetical protein